jgi:hypothetical protein
VRLISPRDTAERKSNAAGRLGKLKGAMGGKKGKQGSRLLKGSMGPLLTRDAAACATFRRKKKWHTARRFVTVLWFGTFHSTGRKGEPTGKKERKARA